MGQELTAAQRASRKESAERKEELRRETESRGKGDSSGRTRPTGPVTEGRKTESRVVEATVDGKKVKMRQTIVGGKVTKSTLVKDDPPPAKSAENQADGLEGRTKNGEEPTATPTPSPTPAVNPLFAASQRAKKKSKR